MARIGVPTGQVLTESRIALESLASYVANLLGMEKARLIEYRPQLVPSSLAEEIRRDRQERAVLAGDSPGHFKPAFTRALRFAVAPRLTTVHQATIVGGGMAQRGIQPARIPAHRTKSRRRAPGPHRTGAGDRDHGRASRQHSGGRAGGDERMCEVGVPQTEAQ